jgi:hypothetical protein
MTLVQLNLTVSLSFQLRWLVLLSPLSLSLYQHRCVPDCAALCDVWNVRLIVSAALAEILLDVSLPQGWLFLEVLEEFIGGD